MCVCVTSLHGQMLGEGVHGVVQGGQGVRAAQGGGPGGQPQQPAHHQFTAI